MFIQKVGGTKGFNTILDMLKDDVKDNGGTASMTIEMFGALWDIAVASFPFPKEPHKSSSETIQGCVVIRKPTDNLEASLEWLKFCVEFERNET